MRNCIYLFPLFLIPYVVAFAEEQPTDELPVKSAELPEGIKLSYIEVGVENEVPVIFIHGTLGDMRNWKDLGFLDKFGKDYRAIAYSRRYNYPNENPLRDNANHSTAVEGKDLAAFIKELNLPKAHIVGYSYGGYTALHLAVHHPEMIRTLVLAEPPLMPWLADLPGNQQEGNRFLAVQEDQFEKPARKLVEQGEVEGAIEVFMDYACAPVTYKELSETVKKECRENADEFIALLKSASMLAPLSRQEVASIEVPVLMLSGERTIGGLQLTDDELEKTLPAKTTTRVTIPNATHSMWWEATEACTAALEEFFKTQDAK